MFFHCVSYVPWAVEDLDADGLAVGDVDPEPSASQQMLWAMLNCPGFGAGARP